MEISVSIIALNYYAEEDGGEKKRKGTFDDDFTRHL